MKDILIIGGNSKLSNYLIPYLKKKFSLSKIISTTRKKSDKKKIYLNFNFLNKFVLPKNISNVIFLAGINNLIECEQNFKKAYQINCIFIPKLIKQLIDNNIKVLFISSNSIFGKKNISRKENDKPNPDIKRGILVKETENKILSNSKKNYLSILRITKMIDYKTEPFNNWFLRIKKKKKNLSF